MLAGAGGAGGLYLGSSTTFSGGLTSLSFSSLMVGVGEKHILGQGAGAALPSHAQGPLVPSPFRLMAGDEPLGRSLRPGSLPLSKSGNPGWGKPAFLVFFKLLEWVEGVTERRGAPHRNSLTSLGLSAAAQSDRDVQTPAGSWRLETEGGAWAGREQMGQWAAG